MKGKFFAGLRIILPLVLFVVILNWAVGVLFSGIEAIDSLFPNSVIESLDLPDWVVKTIGLILICLIVWIIGLFASIEKVKNWASAWFEPVIYRVPLLSHLFKITNQVADSLGNSNSFKRVVLVRFPNNDSWAVGFVTNENPSVMRRVLNDSDLISVVVLASPPKSSFVLLVNPKDTIETKISVASALSFIVSMGVAGATNKIIESCSEM